MKRVVFHSKEDGAVGYYLKKTEEVLKNIDLEKQLGINDLLELCHIKEYFDNDLYLLSWNDSTKSNYAKTAAAAFTLTKKYMLSLNDESIVIDVESLEFDYRKSFWDLVNNLQVYKKINKEVFASLLNKNPHQIREVLSCKNIIAHLDNQIRDFLLLNDKSAELILTKLEEKHRSSEPEFHFPQSLTLGDREKIISNYIDSKDVNLNFLRLIEKSKDTKDLTLSAKVRLRAKNKSEELNNEILKEGNSWSVGVEVSISKDQIEPVKYSNRGQILVVSYSEIFLDKLKHDASLLNIFAALFEYTDDQGIITLFSKDSEMDVLEKLFMKSKNEYPIGIHFGRKNNLAHLQILVFKYYLNQKESSIEKVIELFIDSFLHANFNIIKLQFKFPTSSTTYLEKIRTLAPELEFLLKQYQIFVSEGNIDYELLRLSSRPLRFNEIGSLVEKKYVYANSATVDRLKHWFFSDQSSLYYTQSYKTKYTNLYDLLAYEAVNLDSFADFQKEGIKSFVNEGYLFIDEDNTVKIKDEILLYIIRILHKDEVLSYWHHPESVRKIVDEMVESNLLITEKTLFSRQEVQYLNYYLNKKEFTNGYDLRNKYLHGTNKPFEKEHEMEYYFLLKIIILSLLKIKDDLLLNKTHKLV